MSELFGKYHVSSCAGALPEASPKKAQSSHWGNLWDFCLVPVVVVGGGGGDVVLISQQNNSIYKTSKQTKKTKKGIIC